VAGVVACMGTLGCQGRRIPVQGQDAGIDESAAGDVVASVETSSTDESGAESFELDVTDPEVCQYESDGALGVTIDLTGNSCVYTTAQLKAGVTFTYSVVVTVPKTGILSYPLDAGMCDGPGGSGLRTFEKIHGDGQQYCLCDVGFCGPHNEPVDLAPGTYVETFGWDGRNWNGPSGTDNEKGVPFPPGEYKLVVRAEGELSEQGLDYAITSTMKIIIVE